MQNEMIDVIGSAIENQIIHEIQTAKFLTILADEITNCSNLEQVSIVIRFVDNDKNIREDFLSFITVERITGKSLATTILSWLESRNTDASFCRGQGYDGASNMSSSIAGVQARIRSVSPMAFYTHCHGTYCKLRLLALKRLQQRRKAGPHCC